MISRVPLPEFMPDQSNNSGVLLTAKNVIPAADGYRSLPSLQSMSSALTGTFQGGASAIGAGGTPYLLAGTGTNLYSLQSGGTWTSLVGSLTISNRWRFVQFGNYVVTVNGAATREVALSTGTASAIAGAPVGDSIAVIGDYVVIGQADLNFLKVRWSAFRDHTGWTNGTDQAGELVMQTGGEVMGIAGGEYGIVLQRDRLTRMTRTGDASAPFQFDEISSNFGCASGNTIAQAGRLIFFLSDRGFMALEDGQNLMPIGSEKVDRYFEQVVGRVNLDQIYTAIDPQNKIVMWGVPGTPGSLWIYNFELKKWSTGEFTFGGIFPGFTSSIGLDDLAVIYPDLDAMTDSLDSPKWSGGNPRLYFVDSSNAVSVLTGEPQAATLELGYSEFIPGARARVSSLRPVTDATSGITATLKGKARLGDDVTSKSAGAIRATGRMPVRCSGRYVATTLEVASGTDWDYIQAIEYEYEDGGKR